MKWWIIGFIALTTIVVVAVYGGTYAADNILPYSLLRPTKLLCSADEGNVRIFADDSVTLSATILHTRLHKRGTMIVLHGVAACKNEMLPAAEEFMSEGFDVMLVDMRAHGASSGVNCTYGYREKYDVQKCVDWIRSDTNNTQPIGIYGSSLGASIALQAMSIDKRINFGIVECPFSSLRQVSHDYATRVMFVHSYDLVERALGVAETIARFQVDSVSPARAIRNTTQPILHVHGSVDERISLEHAALIEKNAIHKNSEYHVIKGAHHLDVWSVGGKGYRIMRNRFLERVVP